MTAQPTTPGVALWAAERYNQLAGHQNLGPLSARYGFLPAPGANVRLPESHAAWDDLAAALPDLHRGLTVRTTIDRMPVLSAERSALPDESLQRAAVVLGLLAHAYFHLSAGRPAAPPAAVTRPWAEVCRRLGRSGPYLSYVDLIVCNWQLRDPAAADPMRVSNLRLLVPTVNNEEEHVFHLTQTEIVARTAPIIGATAAIGDAIGRDDPGGVADALGTVSLALRDVTRSSLPTINPRPGSRSYVDPVVWARTVAPFAVPIAPGPLGPSGTAAPLFNLLDSLFGRQTHDSQLGREILGHRTAYPQNWRLFLAAVDTLALGSYVERTGDAHLRDSLREALDAYAGPHGFLAQHRRKVFGYLEIAFKVGRGVTIGGFSGAPRDRTWSLVDRELEKSRAERGASDSVGSVPGAARSAVPRLSAVPRPTIDGSVDRAYPLSELVLHNDDEHGYWISIDREIFDVGGFLRRHPGGPTVLHGYAGGDATQAYHRLHAGSAAAAIALRRCRIGTLSTVSPATEGPDPRLIAGCFDAWAGVLCAVVEMQNALRQDYSLRRGVGPAREAEEPRSPYLLERSIDTFERFLTNYLRPITDAAADVLWPAVIADGADPGWLRERMDEIWSAPAAATAEALPDALRDRLYGGRISADLDEIDARCARWEAACAGSLGTIKGLLSDGMVLLERAATVVPDDAQLDTEKAHHPDTRRELTAVAGQLPSVLTGWLDQVVG